MEVDQSSIPSANLTNLCYRGPHFDSRGGAAVLKPAQVAFLVTLTTVRSLDLSGWLSCPDPRPIRTLPHLQHLTFHQGPYILSDTSKQLKPLALPWSLPNLKTLTMNARDTAINRFGNGRRGDERDAPHSKFVADLLESLPLFESLVVSERLAEQGLGLRGLGGRRGTPLAERELRDRSASGVRRGFAQGNMGVCAPQGEGQGLPAAEGVDLPRWCTGRSNEIQSYEFVKHGWQYGVEHKI